MIFICVENKKYNKLNCCGDLENTPIKYFCVRYRTNENKLIEIFQRDDVIPKT